MSRSERCRFFLPLFALSFLFSHLVFPRTVVPTLPYLNPERTYFCLVPILLVCTVPHCFGDGPGPCNAGTATVDATRIHTCLD